LIGCEGIVGDELTLESSLELLIRFVGRTFGVEDRGSIGKGIESTEVFSLGLFNLCSRFSMNRS